MIRRRQKSQYFMPSPASIRLQTSIPSPERISFRQAVCRHLEAPLSSLSFPRAYHEPNDDCKQGSRHDTQGYAANVELEPLPARQLPLYGIRHADGVCLCGFQGFILSKQLVILPFKAFITFRFPVIFLLEDVAVFVLRYDHGIPYPYRIHGFLNPSYSG